MSGRDLLLLAGRIMGSAIFLTSGYAKLIAPVATKAYFVKVGIPLAEVAYWVAVAAELLGAVGLLLGLGTRTAAAVLAVYCIATAIMVQFDFDDAQKYIHFRKNFAMAGGYLAFIAAGAGAFSLDALLARRQRPGAS